GFNQSVGEAQEADGAAVAPASAEENGAAVAAAAEGAAEERNAGGRDDDVLRRTWTALCAKQGNLRLTSATEAAPRHCGAAGAGSGDQASVELLVPDLEIKSDEGAQQLLWDTSRTFLESLKGHLDFENVSSIFPSPEYQHFSVGRSANVRAIFPDAGSAALLKNQWPDAPFAFSSLMDRKPVQEQDDVVVLITPEYQTAQRGRVHRRHAGHRGRFDRPLIMYNPRLVSGDVGVGLNVRRLRERFLSTLRPRSACARCGGSNLPAVPQDMYMAASGGGGPGAEEAVIH
ncbi:unnamed protein product, partial [Closterium sp. NIES-64]